LPNFVGPTYQARSKNYNAERCINFYPEFGQFSTPKTKGMLVGTPGLRRFVALPAGPITALFSQDQRAFAVGGRNFYELFAGGTYVIRNNDLATDSNPATISSNGTNGHQLFVTSGGIGYIFDLNDNTFTTIAATGFPSPVVMGNYVDSYFIALKAQSNQFNISALLDGLSWNGLDVAQTSLSSDPKLAIGISHRNVFVFGEKRTEVWSNTGAANFPFAPNPGVFIEHGIIAPFSVVNLDNTLYWLGGDEQGAGVVWRANGYTPERVSTHGIEYFINTYPTIKDAIGFAYQDEGHSYFWLYFPTAPTSLVYDVSTGLWHERALWNPDLMDWEPHLARCHCYAFGKHLVGDRQSGSVYHMSLDYLDDEVVVTAP
jgi:hypothetical protein